jgi:hypothetical protein
MKKFNAAAVVRKLNAKFDAAAVVRKLNAKFDVAPTPRLYAITARQAQHNIPRVRERMTYDKNAPAALVNRAILVALRAEALAVAKDGLVGAIGRDQWWTELFTAHEHTGTRIWYRYNPETDRVEWDGKPVRNWPFARKRFELQMTPARRAAVREIEDAATAWFRRLRANAIPPLPQAWMPPEVYPTPLTPAQWKLAHDTYSVNQNYKDAFANIKKALPLDGRLWVWPGGLLESPITLYEIVPEASWQGEIRGYNDRLRDSFPGIKTPYGQHRRGEGITVRRKMHVYTGRTLIAHKKD